MSDSTQFSIRNYVAAEPGSIHWNYEPPSDRGSKVQLLTIGGIQVSGRWFGEWGDAFMAWAPNIKRDKKLETLLWKAKADGVKAHLEQIVEPPMSNNPAVEEARKALRCLHIAVDPSVAADVQKKVEAAFVSLGVQDLLPEVNS